MTYKAIERRISALDGAELVRFIPLFDPDETEIRELWMRRPLHDWLYQRDRKATLNFKANVRGFLSRYVKGGWIDNRDYMKNWRADVWELRVQLQPWRENTRIFGAFAKPDVFVATHQKPRSAFGDGSDPEWDRAIDRVVADWEVLFPTLARVRARPFSNCVTGKGHDHDQ